MKYCIDKIENDIVRLESVEDNSIIEVNVKEFDFNVKEGLVVVKVENGFTLDNKAYNRRKKNARARFAFLIKK